MRAIDTNVLLRLILRDDAGQFRRAEEFAGDGAWVSHVVLVETVWVLASVYRFDRTRIAATVGALLSHNVLVLQDADTAGRALAKYKTMRNIEFSDCLIAEIAEAAGHSPLGSFDKAMAALASVERL